MTIYQVEEGLYRGGPPTVESYRLLSQMSTILNLRSWPPAVRKEYDLFRRPRVRILTDPWMPFMPPSHRCTDAAIALIENKDLRPIYVHCLNGLDRTGYIIAAYRVKKCGWSIREAVTEMRSVGFSWAYGFWIWQLQDYCLR